MSKPILKIMVYIDGTEQSIASEIFGPLWPNGIPSGWPQSEKKIKLEYSFAVLYTRLV